MKRIGIIGAGRFGMSLAETLANAGAEVILIDRNRPAMQSASEFATALQGDATQPHVLAEAGFGECDVVVVAIGSNIEASMMATANCKELGVTSVVAKATSELHGKILRRIGADSVVYPTATVPIVSRVQSRTTMSSTSSKSPTAIRSPRSTSPTARAA